MYRSASSAFPDCNSRSACGSTGAFANDGPQNTASYRLLFASLKSNTAGRSLKSSGRFFYKKRILHQIRNTNLAHRTLITYPISGEIDKLELIHQYKTSIPGRGCYTYERLILSVLPEEMELTKVTPDSTQGSTACIPQCGPDCGPACIPA